MNTEEKQKHIKEVFGDEKICTECGHLPEEHGIDDYGWWYCDHVSDGKHWCNCGNNIGR